MENLKKLTLVFSAFCLANAFAAENKLIIQYSPTAEPIEVDARSVSNKCRIMPGDLFEVDGFFNEVLPIAMSEIPLRMGAYLKKVDGAPGDKQICPYETFVSVNAGCFSVMEKTAEGYPDEKLICHIPKELSFQSDWWFSIESPITEITQIILE